MGAGGVDMCDQLTSYYARDRKGKRYTQISNLPLLVHNEDMRGTVHLFCGAGLLDIIMGTTHLYYN